MLWKKGDASKRMERHKESGTLSGLASTIATISPQFLRHSFVKRQQSEQFNKVDRQRASNVQFADEGLIQIDFAENFVCEAQDEIQSAHWNQRQISLFTSAMYHNDIFQPKVFLSDNITHTKETIIPYMYKLLADMPKTLKTLFVWSDGPSSRFKNKFMASMITHSEAEFNIKIYWNFFATAHGKGCVDGIGATAKTMVRKEILSRTHIVNGAADFVAAFHQTPSNIAIEEVTEADFIDINNHLNTNDIFANARNVRNIKQAHQMQVINGQIVTFVTSKEGYNWEFLFFKA